MFFGHFSAKKHPKKNYAPGNDTDFSPEVNPSCTERTGSGAGGRCEGFTFNELDIPTPPGSTTIDLDLILQQNGLDMSTKELYISLVWSVPCDLDLHVFEPSGFEITWYNMTSDSGGTMDIDYFYVEANQTAIENISWEEPPTGTFRIAVRNYDGCDPEVPFTLFITRQGVRSMLEEVAPAGDYNLYEIKNIQVGASDSSITNNDKGIIEGYRIALPKNDNEPENKNN